MICFDLDSLVTKSSCCSTKDQRKMSILNLHMHNLVIGSHSESSSESLAETGIIWGDVVDPEQKPWVPEELHVHVCPACGSVDLNDGEFNAWSAVRPAETFTRGSLETSKPAV